mmetsp:Transcript_18327/g.37428  ORF Transcript_18327/g.37428 Transcript_18327/m.37428 type:complete len:204 (-) Transcript_18327:146-757(-)
MDQTTCLKHVSPLTAVWQGTSSSSSSCWLFAVSFRALGLLSVSFSTSFGATMTSFNEPNELLSRLSMSLCSLSSSSLCCLSASNNSWDLPSPWCSLSASSRASSSIWAFATRSCLFSSSSSMALALREEWLPSNFCDFLVELCDFLHKGNGADASSRGWQGPSPLKPAVGSLLPCTTNIARTTKKPTTQPHRRKWQPCFQEDP